METLEVTPVSRPVRGAIRPPGSKSLTNRALIVAALAQGASELVAPLESVDTEVMAESLRRLGIDVVTEQETGNLRCSGTRDVESEELVELWCENSGTSIRFLTALCATRSGHFRLDGNARMRERPIAPLVDALAEAGITIRCELDNGCPPVVIESNGLTSPLIRVSGNLSSQYLSGLLMVAPAAKQKTTLEVVGELVSRPYIDMTLQVMRDFGAVINEPIPNRFEIEPGGYQGRRFEIEPDASAASYFFAVAAVTGGEVTVLGLNRRSLQGDVLFVEALERMGCQVDWRDDGITVTGGPLQGIDIDMNAISDTAQTLACVAPFATGPTRIRNVAHMRLKETDRVSAVVTELRRVGLDVEEFEDGMIIYPSPIQPATIQTYDDHRMAMSFALLGLKAPGIRIADPGCTSKTYPEFFRDLDRLCEHAR
ncbi:MAG: 3-phosphoshikimate 1-carboxyvinyltransferase [Planctomycetaceae bacterium]|nr:3-phosphoshikimate 1-carboxyvinyltransferase [Planctomycetaceae bacterium]